MVKIKYLLSENIKEIEIHEKTINVEDLMLQVDNDVDNYIYKLESQKVKGKFIEDFVIYEGVPVYHLFRDAAHVRVKHLFYCIKILEYAKNILEKNELIKVITDSHMMERVSKEIFEIETEYISSVKKSAEIEKKYQDIYEMRKKIGIKNLNQFLKSKKEKVLFFTHAADINYIKFGENYVYYDTQLRDILNKIKEKCDVFNIQYSMEMSLEKSIMAERDFFPYENLETEVEKKENINYKNVIDDSKYIELLDYKYLSYDLKNFMIKYIFMDFPVLCYKKLNEIVYLKRFVLENNIKAVLAMDEFASGKEFIIAGNIANIPTFAVQHGIYEANFIRKINSKYDILIPKILFVWGELYKNNLLKCSNLFNNKNLMIAGQARTDMLINSRNKVPQKDDGEIKILFVTQYFEDILKPSTKLLFKSLRKFKRKYNLIIKLHPADKCYDYYVNMTNKYNISNCKIVKDGDLYEMINWCNIIINVYSTVTDEALLFGKKSICINLPRYNDVACYVKNGIAYGVENEEQLLQLLNKIDEINKPNIDMDVKIHEYINNKMYKVDGKVVERIVNKIYSVIK